MPIHEGGTPLVQKLPPPPASNPPDGPPLFVGDRAVVDAWCARARREQRVARASTLSLAALGAIAAAAEVGPPAAGLALIAAGACLYPLLVVAAGSRSAQRPFEVHEAGVWGTERRRLLRFRRFVRWDDFAVGTAREVAPGRFHMEVRLLGGTVISSVPGELSADAVEYVNERAGHQIRRQ